MLTGILFFFRTLRYCLYMANYLVINLAVNHERS